MAVCISKHGPSKHIHTHDLNNHATHRPFGPSRYRFDLQAALALAELDDKLVGPAIPDERIYDCVNVILSLQNADGGWSTYESTRSYPILEVCPSVHFTACLTHVSLQINNNRGHAANGIFPYAADVNALSQACPARKLRSSIHCFGKTRLVLHVPSS